MAFRIIPADLVTSGKLTGDYTLTGTITAGTFIGNTFEGATFTGTTFEGTDWVLDTSGAFWYNGTPGAGNDPVVAIAAPGITTDPYGNPVKPILTIGQLSGSYVLAGTDGTLSLVNTAGVTVISLHPASGKLQFFDTATGALKAVIQENSVSGENGQLSLSSGVSATPGDVALGILLASRDEASGTSPNICIAAGTPSRLSSALAEIQGSVVVNATDAAGLILVVQNNAAAPSNPAVQVIADQAGDNALGIMAGADTNNRWKWTPSKMQAGPGNAALDTSLYRTSAGAQWATDPLLANTGGSAEGWHPVAYSNGWADAPGRTPSQYRLIPSPASAVQLAGSLTIPSGFAAGQTIFTLPAGYRPATTKSLIGREVTRNVTAVFSISTSGLFAYQGASGALAADTIDFAGAFQTDI